MATNGKHPAEPRLFHIWSEFELRDLPRRRYCTYEAALAKCLVLVYYLETGNTYVIYNSQTGLGVKAFRRTVDGLVELTA